MFGSFTVSSNWKNFSEIKGANFASDKAEYFTTKGTIVTLKKENAMYMVS